MVRKHDWTPLFGIILNKACFQSLSAGSLQPNQILKERWVRMVVGGKIGKPYLGFSQF
jgi:hypothetical protein